jgi:hypothetical protein
MAGRPEPIWSREAFSRIDRCPLEILRLVAPPVGDHRARIVAPLGPVARVPLPAAPVEVPVTRRLAAPSVASLAKGPNAESITPSPTVARRAPNARMAVTPEIRRARAIDRRAATTATSATEPANVDLDPAASVATIARRDGRRRVTADHQAARALRATRRPAGTERTPRRERPGRAVVLLVRPIVREHRDRTVVTTRTPAIADRVCRRAIDPRVARARSVDPAN